MPADFNAGFVKGVAAEAKNSRRRATRTRAKKLADAIGAGFVDLIK